MDPGWLILISSISSLTAIIVLLRFWKPKTIWKMPDATEATAVTAEPERVKKKRTGSCMVAMDASGIIYFDLGFTRC